MISLFIIRYWNRRNIEIINNGTKSKDVDATICVLTTNSSLNGQSVPYLFTEPYLQTRSIKYHFNIIYCDIRYWTQLYNEFELSARSDNNTATNPVFITNLESYYSFQGQSETLIKLTSLNYFAHLWTFHGTHVTKLDFPKEYKEEQLNIISNLTSIPRSKLFDYNQIIKNHSFKQMQTKWYQNWELIDDPSSIMDIDKFGFDPPSMIMFKNNKTNQQLILMKDNHFIPNKNQIELLKKWQPSLFLFEAEPLHLRIIIKTQQQSFFSTNDMHNLGDLALKKCSYSAIALKKESVMNRIGILSLGYAMKVCSRHFIGEQRCKGICGLQCIETLQKNDIDFDLVFADKKAFDRVGLDWWKLFEYLDDLNKKKKKIKLSIDKLRREYYLFGTNNLMRNRPNYLRLIRKVNYPHAWSQITVIRSVVIWQVLMGLSENELVDHKRIVGHFGRNHVDDIFAWHKKIHPFMNIETLFDMQRL